VRLIRFIGYLLSVVAYRLSVNGHRSPLIRPPAPLAAIHPFDFPSSSLIKYIPRVYVKKLIACLSLCLALVRSSAQEDPVLARLSGQLHASSGKLACTQLYLHLDKSIYIHNENIWFAAYVVNSPEDAGSHHTLYVQLADKHTKQVVASEKFILQRGMGAGYLFLPDSLKGGEYNLIAHTNMLATDPDHHVFRQEIRLRGTEEPYTLTSGAGDCVQKNDSVHVKIKVWTRQRLYAEGAEVKYALFAGGEPVATGNAVVNSYGELLAAAPAALLRGKKVELEAAITGNKGSFTSRIMLPVFGEQVKIVWYPEGGDLVQGLESRVAFEARYSNGRPASFKGFLLEDGVKLLPVEANRSGMGFFHLTPKAGRTYSIQSEDSSQRIHLHHPPVKEKGTVMQVARGVANDTVRVSIHTNQYNGSQLYLLGHDYKNEQFFTGVKMQGPVVVKIPVSLLPAGLMTLTLFDSTGQPLAERTVFAGHNRLSKLEITTDSSVYHPRSKVSLKIRATCWQGQPLKASFSLSCILRSRLDSTSFQDIVPFTYLGFYDTHIASRSSLYSIESDRDLEMYLLTRCWTRYKWADPDTLDKQLPAEALALKGQVLLSGFKLKKPVELVVVNGRGMQTLVTDGKGAFELSPELLDHNPDEEVSIMVNVKGKEYYTIELEDRSVTTQQYLAGRPYAEVSPTDGTIAEEEKKQLSSQNLMPAVVVTARQNGEGENQAGGIPVFSSPNCMDYVCMYNILNCHTHQEASKPVHGRTYLRWNGGSYVKVKYMGCERGTDRIDLPTMILRLKGRYYSKEFYVADYLKHNPKLPDTFSTIFWSPQILTNDKGEAELSFYTNDLTGPMILIAEGITDNNVISGKKQFAVRGPLSDDQ
jgi:hypothetical protein